MKTMSIKQCGDASVFEEIEQPKPFIKPGHLLIRVKATSVNPLDCKIRNGSYAHLIRHFPMILHGDVSGVVEEVGENVHNFLPGDAVYGCAGGLLDLPGGLAEYMLVDADLMAHAPTRISLVEAAVLPLVSITAWEGLVRRAKVQPGQSVLIHGGTGGVGNIAIQMAKWLGAQVYASASSEDKLAIARRLGADFAINYKKKSIPEYLEEYTQNRGFDCVFDTVGGENLLNSFKAAAEYGKVITISPRGSYDLVPAFIKNLDLCMIYQPLPLINAVNRKHYGEILSKIAELVDADIIRPLIDNQIFRIEAVSDAHRYLEKGEAIGKVIVNGF